MKFICVPLGLLLLHITVTECGVSGEPRQVETHFTLRWLTETSMEVTYPDTSNTQVKLSPTSSFGDDPTPCLFEGSLGEDTLVDVTVFGCRGEETEVTINSIKWGIHDFILRTNGETEEILFSGSGHKIPAYLTFPATDLIRKATLDASNITSDFSLRWLNETSIEVTYPDNRKTEVKLSPFSSFTDDPTSCLFVGSLGEGSLGEDSLVDVTVIGCRGEETAVTINSIKWGIHYFVLRTSGEMDEIQEDPNYHGKEEEELLPPSKGGFEPDFPDYTPEEPRYLESNFSLRWLNETSMEVTYPDNSKIEVKLSPTSNFDEPTPCLFMGSLGEDANGDVVVIGCLGEETEVTINSIKWGIHDLVLRTNGETEEILW